MRKRNAAGHAVAVALVLVASLTAPVAANEYTERVDECADSFLALYEISHGHADEWIVHELVMCEPWDNEDLSTKSNIKVRLSIDRDFAAERRIKIDVNERGDLVAGLWNWDMSRRFDRLPVERTGDRSVAVRFKPSSLRRGLKRYDWNAMTVSHGCETPAVGDDYLLNRSERCWDYLPRSSGKLRHDLRL